MAPILPRVFVESKSLVVRKVDNTDYDFYDRGTLKDEEGNDFRLELELDRDYGYELKEEFLSDHLKKHGDLPESIHKIIWKVILPLDVKGRFKALLPKHGTYHNKEKFWTIVVSKREKGSHVQRVVLITSSLAMTGVLQTELRSGVHKELQAQEARKQGKGLRRKSRLLIRGLSVLLAEVSHVYKLTGSNLQPGSLFQEYGCRARIQENGSPENMIVTIVGSDMASIGKMKMGLVANRFTPIE